MSMRIRVMGAIFHSPSTAEEISEVTGRLVPVGRTTTTVVFVES